MTIETNEALEARADNLVDATGGLMRGLVALRRARGLSVADIGARMGVSEDTVATIERYDADPSLSTIRRYAMAVDARITTTIVDNLEEKS